MVGRKVQQSSSAGQGQHCVLKAASETGKEGGKTQVEETVWKTETVFGTVREGGKGTLLFH